MRICADMRRYKYPLSIASSISLADWISSLPACLRLPPSFYLPRSLAPSLPLTRSISFYPSFYLARSLAPSNEVYLPHSLPSVTGVALFAVFFG